jgi:hypothetical protein
MSTWWTWALPLIGGAPWLVAIVFYWRRRSHDDEAVPSMAEQARRRLWA